MFQIKHQLSYVAACCRFSSTVFCLFFLWVSFSYANIVVVDDAGREVVLASPAKRIVGLSPHIVENLFSAGAGDEVVAAVEYSDFPESAKKIPRIGRFDTISFENILAINPDLVIVWGSGSGAKVIQKLESLGLTVYVDEPSSLLSIAHSIKQFSLLAGTENIGAVVSDKFIKNINRLKRNNIKSKPINVFYQLWNEPMQTISGGHVISDVIEICGGKNIFYDVVSIAPKINIEAVLSRDPQVIIGSGVDEKRPEWLDEWNRWPSLTAVKNNAIHNIPPDYIQRHTLRVFKGVELMCDYIGRTKSF